MPKRKQKIEPWHLREERKRKKHTVSVRKRYLICTEGKTEAIYFGHYKSSTGPVVVALDKSDHKVSLIKKTIEEKDVRIQAGEFDEEIDEAWVVLDRDANPLNKVDKAHFNRALELAKINNIHVAYSNDAFELWFLLHYQDLWAATHRDQLYKILSTHRNEKYEKPLDLYKEIKSLRSIALKRAAKLLKSDKSPADCNPSTTIHILVEKLIAEPGYREED